MRDMLFCDIDHKFTQNLQELDLYAVNKNHNTSNTQPVTKQT